MVVKTLHVCEKAFDLQTLAELSLRYNLTLVHHCLLGT